MPYNLTENLSDSFEFKATLQGKEHRYTVKYPSQKELDPIQRGYSRLSILNDEIAKVKANSEESKKIEEEVKEISENMTKAFTDLFSAQDDSMPVGELLENLPLNAKRNFDKMIQAEFGTNEE